MRAKEKVKQRIGKEAFRVDLATMLGILIGAGALVAGFSLDGGLISSLWLFSAFIIVIGGSIGSLAISYGMKDVTKMPHLSSAF